ncbi:MAG: hypothetical protein KatS3mg038_3820 [Candidatus Kapaibacterium sp.]|nr:MAG: hypothetical protein KatS3mg038_2595 [Candidatus Kapabacteria bacterium]GIV53299.1 MAG: hypothetical protein KatS3mg038_3820 [Candidatus Kapabacteria bacterium]
MPLLPPTIYDDTIVAIDTLRSNGGRASAGGRR